MMRRYRIIVTPERSRFIAVRVVLPRCRTKVPIDRSRAARSMTHMEMLISLIKRQRPGSALVARVPFAFYMEIVIMHRPERYARAAL